jgi:hypothetical protein
MATKKKTIKIADDNVAFLKEIDFKIKQAQDEITEKVNEYNKLATALNAQKQFILKTVINQAGMADVPRWLLTSDYELVEQTEEEYEASLEISGAIEHKIEATIETEN